MQETNQNSEEIRLNLRAVVGKNKEDKSNKVTSISAASTTHQYLVQNACMMN